MLGYTRVKTWFFTILFLSSSAFARTPEDDRLIHAGLSFGIAMTAPQVFKKMHMGNTGATILGTLFTMAVGVGKEMTDAKFDSNDIVSNGIGAGSSFLLNITLDL